MGTVKVIAHPIFPPDFESWMAKSQDGESGTLLGQVRDDGSVYIVEGIVPRSDEVDHERKIGVVQRAGQPRQDGERLVLRWDAATRESWAEIDDSPATIRVPIDSPDLARLFVRVDAAASALGELAKKRVVIVGVGSGGALIASYLAKSGVRRLTLIDGDRLEVHNVVRHICSLSDYGRYKTRAVSDYIQERVPGVAIETIERQVLLSTSTEEEFWRRTLQGADLIISASGEHHINYAINSLAHSLCPRVPVVYAGTFGKVAGGLMFLDDGNRTWACYECFYGRRSEDAHAPIDIAAEDATVEYDRSEEDRLSQPGLGVDVDNITILVTKFCLGFLVKEVPNGLYRFPHPFYVWSNRDHTANGRPFEGLELSYYDAASLLRDPACRVCGDDA